MKASAITKGTILNLSSNPDTYERGERMFREGKLLSFKTLENPEGGTLARSTVEGNYKNYDVTLKLDDGGGLVEFNCSCESHSIWRGACKHAVAVLFAQMEGSVALLSADTMRQHSVTLTNALEKLIYDNIDAELAVLLSRSASQIKLTPVLHLEPRGVYITLTVGIGRMYVIKNIALFVESCKREETVSYGQGLSFPHRRNQFCQAGQKLLDFVMAEDTLYTEVGKRLSKQFPLSRRPLSGAREIPIGPRNIDEFFDLYDGQMLEGAEDLAPEVLIRTGKPPLRISVAHNNAGTTIKAEFPSFRAISGRRAHYMLMENQLLRLGAGEGSVILRLLEALGATPRNEILFTGQEEQRFLSIVLPKLAEMELVHKTEGTPPIRRDASLVARLYLESTGPSRMEIFAHFEFQYGDKVIKPSQPKDSDKIPRDMLAEYTLKRMMGACGFTEKGGLYYLKGNDMIYGFLYERGGALESFRKLAEVYVSEELQRKTRRPPKARVGVRLMGNLLNISVDETGYTLSDLLDALEAYRAKKKFFRLKDGSFLSLDDESMAAPLKMLDALDATRKDVKGKYITMPAYRALYVDELMQEKKLSGGHTRDSHFAKLVEDFKNNANLGFKTPRGLTNILRDYQKTGFYWLKTLTHYGFGGILADDMGLGKTLQVIALLESDRKGRKRPSLVVAPTSLLYNWENEFARFAPEMRTQVVTGFPDKRRELLENPEVDVFITTYDMLKRDIGYYKPLTFSYIIADEAQNIKNPATQAAKSIKSLTGKTRFALTGTPIENNLSELWSIFDFIMPGYLYTAGKFQRLYETPIVRDDDKERAAQLRAQIGPFVLRRIKANVLKELPEKTETTLPAELTPEQKRIYQAHLLEALGALDDYMKADTFADNRMRVLAQLTRLRQICCHPGLFIDDYAGGSGKFELALETVQIALESGHRVLLFSQFTGVLDLLRKKLDEENTISYFYLDGATKAKDRMEMTTRFNAGEKDIFLISLKAGGTGLNLTGADVVIHYDPWWNPSVMDQASDRAHRYGQKKAVQVFNIVAKDSIEEKIMRLQEKKRDLIDSVITEGGSFINLLSAQEVRKLFVD
ncbi:MAG: DEAD/DEAH box helicase [Defluviitaleaceae bacterium]|nr:DEAD/DEAH box helicase [Defluviitaleaceae bacterium]MCL2240731.1 DEAD/DEAH box helicase [Defluviitaleaceae bacterium]